MDVSSIQKDRGIKNKQTIKTENSIYTLITDCNRQTKGQAEPTITTSGVGLADGLFCMLRKKKKEKRESGEKVFSHLCTSKLACVADVI